MVTPNEEQLKAINHDSGNIIVSASAGSGKTFVMISRLIRLIKEGKAKVSEILCVTFTEASARDMKEKLKKDLTEEAVKTKNEKLFAELSEIPTADVSTIDSFCLKLLRKYFYKAGVSPDFRVANSAETDTLRKKAIDKTFAWFYDSQDEEFLKLARRYRFGRGNSEFRKKIIKAYDFISSEADEEQLLSVTERAFSPEGYEKIKNDYLASIKEQTERLSRNAGEIANDCEEYPSLKKFAEYCKDVATAVSRSSDLNTVKVSLCVDYPRFPTVRTDDEYVSALKENLKSIKERLVALKDNAFDSVWDSESEEENRLNCYAHARAFCSAVRKFSQYYAEEKRSENVMDFSDLEHFALKILCDEEVLKSVRERYKFVFCDEYQDVNGAQEKIMSLVSDDNLFMVGDVKQSIYGFRGCKPELFTEKFFGMQKRGEAVVRLNNNFRSSKAVVDMVNAIFSFSMTDEIYGENYKTDSALVFGGAYPPEAEGRASLCLLKKTKKKRETEEPRIYSVFEKTEEEEEKDVSLLIAKLIDDELGKTFYSAKEKKFKHVSYGDVAVLARTKNDAYARNLVAGLRKRGIPVLSDVNTEVTDYAEVKTLVALLRLIDDFNSDVPLATTMKSPVGGFSEEDLVKIRFFFDDERKAKNIKAQSGSFREAYDYFLNNGEGDLKERLTRFDDYVKSLRILCDFVPAKDLLKKVVREKSYEAYLLSTPDGEEKLARVRFFIRAVAGGDRPMTVRQAVALTETSQDAFRMNEGVSGDCVKVMTIHASKGLEFPVVIVCGLERDSDKRDEGGSIISDREYGLSMNLYDDRLKTTGETVLRGLLKQKKSAERLKEELRLFYVATTRAQYSLYLVFEAEKDERSFNMYGADGFIDYVPRTLPVREFTDDELVLYEQKKKIRKVLIGERDEEKEKKMLERFSFAYPFEQDTLLSIKTSVTASLKQANEQTEDYYKTETLFDETEKGVTSREKGIIAHKFLQFVDFKNLNDLPRERARLIADGIMTEEEFSSIDFYKIEKALRCDVFKGMDGGDVRREEEFIVGAPSDLIFHNGSATPVLLQGVIDLLAIKDGEAVIVDYKYSVKSKQALLDSYSAQLDLYEYATKKILGVPVTAKIIVNLLSGEIVSVPLA